MSVFLFWKKAPKDLFTLTQPGFSSSKIQGGLDIVPKALTLLPFSKSIKVTFSESLSKAKSPDTTIETMVSVVQWLVGFRFLNGNTLSKSKTVSPLLKVNKSYFFWKHFKTESNDTIVGALDIVLPNLVGEARKELGAKLSPERYEE